MQFEFENHIYRIAFRHEVSRKWEDHLTHLVRLSRDSQPSGALRGAAYLICDNCSRRLGREIRLSHLPKAERDRRTFCQVLKAVQRMEGSVESDIEFRGQTWRVCWEGVGRVNRGRGDQYRRDEGRLAALRNALDNAWPDGVDPASFAALDPESLDAITIERIAKWRREFKTTAWAAYRHRTDTANSAKP